MQNKLFYVFFALVVILCNACSDEEEAPVIKEERVSYTLYMEVGDGSAPDGHGANAMLERLRNALGVESNDFYLYGEIDKCDSKVYDKCDKCFNSFSYGDFPLGGYSPRVRNNNKGRNIWFRNIIYL